MHLPDMVLQPVPTVVSGALGVAGLAWAVRRLRGREGDRATVLMGAMGACVFAAQMVNFPLYPWPISGHLMGGVLAAVVLGPAAGIAVMALVLMVQAFLFGDGGITALGANFVNMGLIGSGVGYAIYATLRRRWAGGLVGPNASEEARAQDQRAVVIAAMAASWFSVLLASGSLSIQLTLFGPNPGDLPMVLGWMTLVHCGIGLGEAMITGLAIRFLLLTRPDLIPPLETATAPGLTSPTTSSASGRATAVFGGLGIALAIAAFLAPLASDHPDGFEWTATRLGFLDHEDQPEDQGDPAALVAAEGPAGLGREPANEPARPLYEAPLPDYAIQVEGPLGDWFRDAPSLSTAIAGIIGTLTVFLAGWIIARGLETRRPPTQFNPTPTDPQTGGVGPHVA